MTYKSSLVANTPCHTRISLISGVTRLVRAQLEDPGFPDLVAQWMREVAPEAVPDRSKTQVWKLANTYQVATDIDLERVQRAVTARQGGEPFKLGVATILVEFAASFEDISFAAKLNAEISTNYFRSPLLRHHAAPYFEQASSSAQQLAKFTEASLGTANAIAEAVNERTLTFRELIPVLRAGHRFKKWIAGKPFDSDLIADYYREATRESLSRGGGHITSSTQNSRR